MAYTHEKRPETPQKHTERKENAYAENVEENETGMVSVFKSQRPPNLQQALPPVCSLLQTELPRSGCGMSQVLFQARRAEI